MALGKATRSAAALAFLGLTIATALPSEAADATPSTTPGMKAPQVFLTTPFNPGLLTPGAAPSPPPGGSVAADGSVIAPADIDGRLTPDQVQAARRGVPGPSRGSNLNSAPPAIGIDAQGQGVIGSGASIR